MVDCPEGIAHGARAFLAAADLTYGAFDFAVAADSGEWTFLECNAAGQWGWLAEECGLPIAAAIAGELTKEHL